MSKYHKREITKGVLGEVSKIAEELEEVLDSEEQNNPIMLLVELSDMLGAMELYLEKHHPSITLQDLITMQKTTRRVFESGGRS